MSWLKLPKENVDRETFWMWAVPLAFLHVVASFASAAGIPAASTGDTILVIWYAIVLGRRFGNIGWPAWIAVALVVTTMVVIPLGLVGYAIAKNIPRTEFMSLMGTVGVFNIGVNLIMMVVAGSVRGNAPAAPAPASLDGFGPPPIAAPAEPRRPDPIVVGAVIVFAVAAIGLVVALLFPHQHATQALSSPPPVSSLPAVIPAPAVTPSRPIGSAGGEVQSNGLTKNTNDFLRQLSQQPRAANR